MFSHICAEYDLRKCVFMRHPTAVQTPQYILLYSFFPLFFLGREILDTCYTHYVHFTMKHERYRYMIQCMWKHFRIWVYNPPWLLYYFYPPIILNFFFLILFTIEFLVLRVVEKKKMYTEPQAINEFLYHIMGACCT